MAGDKKKKAGKTMRDLASKKVGPDQAKQVRAGA